MSVRTGTTKKGNACVVIENSSEKARLVAEGFCLPRSWHAAMFTARKSAYYELDRPMVDISERVDPVAFDELWKAARRWETEQRS